MKRMVLTAAVLLSTTQVFAFDFMGPSTSTLKTFGQSSVAVEYFWGSMDIDADSIPEFGLLSDTIENVGFSKASANLTVGLGSGSEIFARLGVAQLEPDEGDNRVNVAGYVGCSDESFFAGGGAKWTLAEGQSTSWGLLTQASWVDFDFDGTRYSIGGHDVASSTEVRFVEVQIATGPTIDLAENMTVYGGPFLHFLTGDMDLEGTIDGLPASIETDLDQESILGGYIGTQVGLGQNVGLNIEFQKTSGNFGVGGQLVWRF